MFESAIFSLMWMVSICLAGASLIVFVCLVITRGISQYRSDQDTLLRQDATRTAVMWVECESSGNEIASLSRRKRMMLISVIAELIPTIRGEARVSLIQFVENLGGVDVLVRSAKSRKAGIRMNAVSLLKYFASPCAQTALRSRLLDPIFAIRAEAITALQYGPDPLNFDRIVSALCLQTRIPQLFDFRVFKSIAVDNLALLATIGATHRSPKIRMLSAHGMGSTGDFSSLLVLSTMANDQDEFVRAEVMRALGSLKHPHAENSLYKAITDDSWRVRAAAAESIGLIGIGQSKTLRKLSSMDGNWWVRYCADEALRRLELEFCPVSRKNIDRTISESALTLSQQGQVL